MPVSHPNTIDYLLVYAVVQMSSHNLVDNTSPLSLTSDKKFNELRRHLQSLQNFIVWFILKKIKEISTPTPPLQFKTDDVLIVLKAVN